MKHAMFAVIAAGMAALACTSSATAATPTTPITGGTWAVAGAREVPLRYFQGLTHTTSDDFLFIGIFKGGYRTDGALKQLAGNDSLVPAAVEQGVGFNHIGDPTYDRSGGGRLLVPLECYDPAATSGNGNTCGMGGFAVVDPVTLAWRYWVRLDPADIPKAMWAELSPDGKRLWTSSGNDLLAYATADVDAAHAATDASSPPIKPIARLTGAVPASGITGAAFVDGRLFLAGEADKVLQIASVDLATGKSRVEATFPGLQAEPEGLDLLDNGGGALHFLLSPFGDNGPATFGDGHSELLTLIPTSGLVAVPRVAPGKVKAGKRTTVTVTVSQDYAGVRHPVARAKVTIGGATATTDAKGRARLKVTAARRGTLKVSATKTGLRPGRAGLAVG